MAHDKDKGIIKVPVCNPHIKGVKIRESAFEKYISRMLRNQGFDVKSQVVFKDAWRLIKIDLVAQKRTVKRHIEVKYITSPSDIAKYVGQVLWYEHFIEKPVFLALWCSVWSKLTPVGMRFLKKLRIKTLIVTPSKYKFFNQVLLKNRLALCEKCPKREKYSRRMAKSGQLYNKN